MSDPEQERGFTGFWIPVDIINAENLTWQQRLIWAEIQSLQKGRLGKCIASNDHFMAVFGIGEGTVKNAMTELKRHGWIRWTHDGTTRELYATYPEEIPISGIPKSGIPKSGHHNPEIGIPVYKENSIKNSSLSPICPPKEEELKLAIEFFQPVPDHKDPEKINAIYQAYPYKKAKDEALKAIAATLKKIPFPDLLPRVQAFAVEIKADVAAGRPWSKVPYPATWFNRGSWQDDHHETTTHDSNPKPAPAWHW